MPNVAREKEMNVSRDALRQAILDFNSYPQFLSEVLAAKARPGGTPACTYVDYEVEVLKRFQYTLEFKFDIENEIRWSLYEGKLFKKNEGKWVLEPRGNGKLLARYELDLELGFFVPSWVTKKLTETSLPQLLDNFEKQALKFRAGG